MFGGKAAMRRGLAAGKALELMGLNRLVSRASNSLTAQVACLFRSLHQFSQKPIIRQLFNAGLRLSSLVAKLLLTLYMGRYLGLSEMGTYGLVAAYVAIAIPLLGLRLDYVVAREIVDVQDLPLTVKMRDQAVFYGLNYLLFAALALGATLLWPDVVGGKVVLFAVILAVSESTSAVTSGNLIALKQPILSTALFFVRSALWVFPVIGLGLFYPELRTANFVLGCWLAGVLFSLVVMVIIWWHLPWQAAFATPVSWTWVRASVKTCLPIWLGAVGAAASSNLDRFVVEYYLGRDFVGIASFYGSFLVAMIALLQNGVIAFSYPRLVSSHKQSDREGFRQESYKMLVQCAISSAIMALVIGVVVPWLGHAFGRPEFADHAPVLWLMLLGVWIKSLAEGLYYVLYARHQDRAIWLGNLLLLPIALVTSVVGVGLSGFAGIGYSAVACAIFIALWRLYWVQQYRERTS